MNTVRRKHNHVAAELALRRRKHIRLKDYDYRTDGYYFVTICAKDRKCLFGEIVGGEMQVNGVGRMVQSVWEELPRRYPGVGTDTFITMPNHVHGIIVLDAVGAGPRACPDNGGQPQGVDGQPQGVAPTVLSLPDVVHRFKSLTTTRYRQMNGQPRGVAPTILWQRNYYEHIIRNEMALLKIREYIQNNPAAEQIQWGQFYEKP